MTPGELLSLYSDMRDQTRYHNAQLDLLKASKKLLENAMEGVMTNLGTNMLSGNGMTATMKLEEIPEVDDWEAFYNYIVNSKSPHLLQRRVATNAVLEMRKITGEVPKGIAYKQQNKMSFRARR